nr:VP6 [Shelly beach virus]
MTYFNNASYIIDKHFNDLGPHASSIAPVGKTEVTILDNLYHIATLIHGRILSSSNIAGGYRVYIPRGQLKDLILAYQSIAVYKLSENIDSLIQSLRALLTTNSNDVEIGIDNRIVLQMITVHNGISIKLRGIWEGVVALRFLSCSGFNKDMTIDGRQQTFNTMLSRFSNSEMQSLIPHLEKSGQLAGLRCPRQIDARDMIADLLFSRKDAYTTLHDLFYSMKKQRSVLREFRTDILFCPVERYRELELGWSYKASAIAVTESQNSVTIAPARHKYCEFIIRNTSFEAHKISVTGSMGNGVITIHPLQEIRITGTSLILPESAAKVLRVTLIADIRDITGNGNSIVSLAMRGELQDDAEMSNIFYQIIKPIIPYLKSLVKRCTESEVLSMCVSKMDDWIKTAFLKMKPGSVYEGWFLTDQNAAKERLLYIYLLSIMLPEYLLDPTFTFSDSVGTPPYLHDYGFFVQSLKTLYE